jgi:hypothetical protein
MKIDISFPDGKISEAFLEFAEPLLEKEGAPPTREEIEKALGLAFLVWNAVVYDTVHRNTEWVTRVRNQVAGERPIAAFVEQLIERKRNLFGHDQGLVGE